MAVLLMQPRFETGSKQNGDFESRVRVLSKMKIERNFTAWLKCFDVNSLKKGTRLLACFTLRVHVKIPDITFNV